MNHCSRSACNARTLVGLAALVAVLAFTTAAMAQPQSSKAPPPCGAVAKGGAPWSYKGQKGTAYTVIGVNGALCATGLKFMSKWTRDREARAVHDQEGRHLRVASPAEEVAPNQWKG